MSIASPLSRDRSPAPISASPVYPTAPRAPSPDPRLRRIPIVFPFSANRKTVAVDGHELHLYHANQELYNWISRKNDLLARMGDDREQVVSAISMALQASEEGVRIAQSVKLIADIWKRCLVLPPNPLLHIMPDAQADRQMWVNYREHMAHQFKVFLIGLYLLDRCSTLRDTVQNDDTAPGTSPSGALASEDALWAAWVAAALWHDVGYVFECDAADQPADPFHQRVLRELNAAITSPLASAILDNSLLTPTQEADDAARLEISIPPMTSIDEIETGPGSPLSQFLKTAAERSWLAEHGVPDPIASAYKLARTEHTVPHHGNRIVGRDHGIAGALTLLKLFAAYEKRLTDLHGIVNASGISAGHLGTLRVHINERYDAVRRNRHAVFAAAQAISLHNINLRAWSDANRRKHRIRHEDQYRIVSGLPHSSLDPSRRCPLAFLLGFADSLQDWDRPLFRAYKFGERRLTQQDFGMKWERSHPPFGALEVHFPNTRHKQRAADVWSPQEYLHLVENLKQYLDPDAIDHVLKLARRRSPARKLMIASVIFSVALVGAVYTYLWITRPRVNPPVLDIRVQAGSRNELNVLEDDVTSKYRIESLIGPEPVNGKRLYAVLSAAADDRVSTSQLLLPGFFNRILVYAPYDAVNQTFTLTYSLPPEDPIFADAASRGRDRFGQVRISVIENPRPEETLQLTTEGDGTANIDLAALVNTSVQSTNFFPRHAATPLSPTEGDIARLPKPPGGNVDPHWHTTARYVARPEIITGTDHFYLEAQFAKEQRRLIPVEIKIRRLDPDE